MTVIANAVTTHSRVSGDALVWTELGPGLWVAKAGADFAGLVEKLWGAGYRATDCNGTVVGEYASISSAQAHVAS